ncbi:nucleoside recognition protein [Lutibacter sp. B2]|nr:nucleoside recognition protein [Lutibacter sp. B2]
MLGILKQGLMGSFDSVCQMAIIIIPIMIILQLANDYKILAKISKPLSFITKFLGLSESAVFPLLVGFFIGISYGAGVIIESVEEGNISKRDTFLLVIFLVTCHAIIEDTLVFVVVGADGLVVASIRILAAILLTYVISKNIKMDDQEVLKSKAAK